MPTLSLRKPRLKASVRSTRKCSHLTPNLFLIGFMGAGKSTIGEWVAKKTGMGFIDTDVAIESFLGMSIATVFHQYGEPFFRQMERVWIQEHLPLSGYVVACGGGLPMAPGAIELLKNRGIVINLAASTDTLWGRLQDSIKPRPLLQTPIPYETLSYLYQQRLPLYTKAHVTVPTDAQPIAKVALRVKEAFRARI